MPDFALSGRAGPAGTARITVAGFIPSGLVWVVSQVGIEAQSAKPTMSAVLRKNGRFITSSASGLSSSAAGAPYLSLKSPDQLTSMSAVLRKNGRFITSSASGLSSSAAGAPYLSLKSPDQLTVDYAGLNNGDTVLLTLFYREITWGQLDTMPIEVV